MIDTHSHIFDTAFDDDRLETIQRAEEAGVDRFIMPAIDSTTHEKMFEVALQYKNHFPTIGLHPTSINGANLHQELEIVEQILHEKRELIYAIGEIGLDQYWSKEFTREQEFAFRRQLEWAIDKSLPVIIHTRECWGDMINILSDYKGSTLRAIMHGYSGSTKDADKILSFGDHLLGIGGVVTFKKSTLSDVVKEVGIENIVLETDAPYLAPVPFRGKRNESSYIPYIVNFISNFMGKDFEEIDKITNFNAEKIFKI